MKIHRIYWGGTPIEDTSKDQATIYMSASELHRLRFVLAHGTKEMQENFLKKLDKAISEETSEWFEPIKRA